MWFAACSCSCILDTRNSVAAAAGRLPVASKPVTRHATVRCNPFTRVPTDLVAAANNRSVPTAVTGWMPNSRISNGVISEPPPTPVTPTRNPTQRPSTA